MSGKKRLITAAALNGVLAVLETVANVYNFRGQGAAVLRYYTADSNLLSLVASVLFVLFAVRELRGGKPVPAAVRRMRFVATSCLAVTLIVVAVVLAPTLGGLYALHIKGGMLYNHTLCPILAAVTCILFETDPPLEKKDALLVPAVTFLYGLIVVPLNLLHVVNGPYPFLKVNDLPVRESVLWYIAILTGAWAVGFGIVCLNRLCAGKRTKKEEENA